MISYVIDGDIAQSGFHVDPNVDKTHKVSKRTHFHVFTPKQVHSIFLSLKLTPQTHYAPQGPFLRPLPEQCQGET